MSTTTPSAMPATEYSIAAGSLNVNVIDGMSPVFVEKSRSITLSPFKLPLIYTQEHDGVSIDSV